ncbi:MAG: hypothetical protein M1829_001520 [Trizodia sp. TS-e1964]|nr:MAG: hypothetical protein M1829_001520 [Trizodia sp. TS-e1964]
MPSFNGNPALTISHLSSLTASLSATDLVNALSGYEEEMALHFDDFAVFGDIELLTTYYSTHILVLLLLDELSEARFLTLRFPPTLSEVDGLLVLSKKLLRAVWSKEYADVYRILENTMWPDGIKPLINQYSGHFRAVAFKAISRAYTTIPSRLAIEYLGLPKSTEDSALEDLIKEGWTWNAGKTFLQTSPAAATTSNWTGRGPGIASLIGVIGFLGE